MNIGFCMDDRFSVDDMLLDESVVLEPEAASETQPQGKRPDDDYSAALLRAAGIRAVRTMAEVAAAYFTVGMDVSEIDWQQLFGVVMAAGIYSLLMSIAGLPEVE